MKIVIRALAGIAGMLLAALLAPGAHAADAGPITIEMVAPFFDGSTDADQLLPLREWIANRVATAGARRATGEIRDVLKKIRREREDSLQHPFDLVVSLRAERGNLRGLLLSRQIDSRSAFRQLGKLTPLPTMDELFPTITGSLFSIQADAGNSASGGAPGAATAERGEQPPPTSSVGETPANEMDPKEMLDRLDTDLAVLDRMVADAFQQDDAEETRLQRALKALPEFIKSVPVPARASAAVAGRKNPA